MKKVITQWLMLCSASFCLRSQTVEVVTLSPVVGDTISAEENRRYRLFPFFPASTFSYAVIYKQGPDHFVHGHCLDSTIVKKISQEQLQWFRALVEPGSPHAGAPGQPSNGTDLEVKIWLTFGLSVFSSYFSMSGQHGHQLFTFRAAKFHDEFFTISYKVRDYAVLYGLATKQKQFCASFSVGPAWTRVIKYQDSRFLAGILGGSGSLTETLDKQCAGIASHLDFTWTPLPFFGLGLYLDGNHNKHQIVSGMGILLRIGTLR